jgi:hypothetical protein
MAMGKRVTTTFASGEGRERRANARKTRENEEGGLSRDARATGRRRGRRAGATWILSECAD